MSIKKEIGIIGMGTMGRNLSLNFNRRGYDVSIFNRSYDRVKSFLTEHAEKNLKSYISIKKFVLSLKRPRCILIMVQAGSSVDQVIMSLIPFLSKGDILIDGGNSFYKDTIRRNFELYNLGIYLVGLGVSGGKIGALYGPSFMPGCHKDAYDIIEPIFKEVSAYFQDEACITYIGENGSGHYVKMVHNGIEYADMQLISEAYVLLKYFLKLDNEALSNIFDVWNHGELNSYLIDITKNIFLYKKEDGHYLLDFILDKAENNGTGQWVSQSALEYGEPLNVITESVFVRYLSIFKSQRILASKILRGPSIRRTVVDVDKFIEDIRRALYLCKVISYSQGFSQLRIASSKYHWDLNYANIAKIFRSGCIIRAQLLQHIVDAYIDNSSIDNLLLAPYFKNIANSYQESLRSVVTRAIHSGIPILAFSAAVGYYDSYRSSVLLSANLIQAQRDYFGSHGYQLVDREGKFSSSWL